jgi:hypothetical protein
MSKTQHIEKDTELQRQKKVHRKLLLQQLTNEIDEQEVEQVELERSLELVSK